MVSTCALRDFLYHDVGVYVYTMKILGPLWSGDGILPVSAKFQAMLTNETAGINNAHHMRPHQNAILYDILSYYLAVVCSIILPYRFMFYHITIL